MTAQYDIRVFPCRTMRTVVFADRSPGAFAEIGSPPLPRGTPSAVRNLLSPQTGAIPGIICGPKGSCLCRVLANKAMQALLRCRRVAKLFDAFVDDELTPAVQVRVRHHVAGCRACTAIVKEKVELKRLVRAGVGNPTAPATLRDRLRIRIGS